MAGRIPNDHWTLDLGGLGLEETGQRLARLVLQCQPPYAIGVQGKWGSGKTSLMRYAMAVLGGEPLAMTLSTSKDAKRELPGKLQTDWEELQGKTQEVLTRELLGELSDGWEREYEKRVQVVPIWFNPWQHQHADLPLIALLQEVRAQFSYLLKAGEKVRKLSQVGVEAGLNLLGELVDLYAVAQGGPRLGPGGAFDKVRKTGETYERRNFEGMENAQRLNLLFEEAVQRLLRPQRDLDEAVDGAGRIRELRRLVIFIDDLDRCSDAQTVRLLEAIKLYLQTPYCVFVIGMDGTAARRAVQRVLPHTGAEEAQEYLEKLFQARLHVQVPQGHEEKFVKDLLDDCALDDQCTGLAAPTSLAQDIATLVEPNPRKLKNFVGSLGIAWQIAYPTDRRNGEGATPPMDFRAFLLAAYLRSYHPEVFRLLSYEPHQAAELHRLLNEGLTQLSTRPSPVELFLYQRFRHASKQAFPQIGGDEAQLAAREPKREEIDLVAKELTERLDRRRGDEAFVKLWQEVFRDSEARDVTEAFTLALQVAANVAQPDVEGQVTDD